MTKKPTRRRKSVPIFAKCLIILFGTCGILAATLTINFNRTSGRVATTAAVTFGASITEISAVEISGPVRFNDKNALQERLLTILDSTRMGDGALVVGQDGSVLFRFPESLSQDRAGELGGFAQRAAADNETITNGDGLLVAVPVRFGPENTAIGAVAIRWNPVFLHDAVRKDKLLSIVIGLVVMVVMSLVAMLAVRKAISIPLTRMNERTIGLANQDFTSEIPFKARGDEIGQTALALETLRAKLAEAEEAKVDTFFKSAGFQSSSAAMILCDEDLNISHVNKAFLDLAETNIEDFRIHIPGFDGKALIGVSADMFYRKSDQSDQPLAEAKFPIETDIRMGDLLLGLVINRIVDASGATAGYVLEWSEVTERRKQSAILHSLEQAQLRADFNADGALVSVNGPMAHCLDIAQGMRPVTSLTKFVARTDGTDFGPDLHQGKATFGKFGGRYEDARFTLDGSISPTCDRTGKTMGYVLLGNDITESEQKLAQATEENARLSAAQAAVVEALQSALTSLSMGNLRTRIDTEFTGRYEALRRDFNSAVTALDAAIGQILVSADSILNESGNVSGAADDLSRRTEQQAATLEETAAAISQLTASVASAASGAKQANDVVTEARDNAAASGEVVQQAVDAMGEIEKSSDQISRIIGVIDEIAFQTNLLALNAGVEAARAGDAGRGFAVVASEVRALAQRSSDAAREITDLISTSGDHVKKGVSLVGKAGHALTEIVQSVGGIAEHVSGIAASAREQSTGLEEINAAMNQLDQVTQKNVAMFEETTAASQTMTTEANALVGITRQFECTESGKTAANASGAALLEPAGAAASMDADVPKTNPADGHNKGRRAAAASLPPVAGNLALAAEDSADDDWEEF